MTKLKIFFFFLISGFIIFSACSKKVSTDQLVGKWKAVDFGDTTMRNIGMDIFFEFTSDKIIYEGVSGGQPMNSMEVPYTLKSIEGNTINLIGTYPQTQEKGDFKIVLEGKKITLTDPTQAIYILQKQ